MRNTAVLPSWFAPTKYFGFNVRSYFTKKTKKKKMFMYFFHCQLVAPTPYTTKVNPDWKTDNLYGRTIVTKR